MKNITVAQFLNDINQLISHWNGVKIIDNSEMHHNINDVIADYLKPYPELQASTWVIRWNPEMDFSMSGQNEELFVNKWVFEKNKRTHGWTKGKIISVEYKPNFSFDWIDYNVNDMTLHDYVNLCRIEAINRKLITAQANIVKCTENLLNANAYEIELLEKKIEVGKEFTVTK